MSTATALTVVPAENPREAMRYSLVQPLVDPATARVAIRQYEALKTAIVQPGDIQRIQGRDFLKKSFWRRVATCFGLSLELVSESRGFDEAGKLYYSVIYRAIAPNGRAMTADGYCSQSEPGRGSWPEHNVRATAHTRAKNRAISDLVGGGEVSAEEFGAEEFGDEEREVEQEPARKSKHTRSQCSQYAKDHGLSLAAYNRAATKYADNDELYAALEDGVRILEEKAKAKEREQQAAEAQPEITFTPEDADSGLDDLPVGARGN